MVHLDDIEVLVGVGVCLIRPVSYGNLFAHVGNGQHDLKRRWRFCPNRKLCYGRLEAILSHLDLIVPTGYPDKTELASLIGCPCFTRAATISPQSYFGVGDHRAAGIEHNARYLERTSRTLAGDLDHRNKHQRETAQHPTGEDLLSGRKQHSVLL